MLALTLMLPPILGVNISLVCVGKKVQQYNVQKTQNINLNLSCFKFSVNVNDVHIFWMKFNSDGAFDANSLGNSNSRRCNLRRQVLREVACTIHMKIILRKSHDFCLKINL